MDFILITTSKTYDLNNRSLIVGGIQTYTRDLCLLAQEKGYHPIMYQIDCDQVNCTDEFDGIEYHVIQRAKRRNQYIFDQIYLDRNHDHAIFVIATDQMDIRTRAKNVIVIQHGIAFDNPILKGFWSRNRCLIHFNKFLKCYKNVKRLYWSRNTVGVDYNYFNWFRTIGMLFPEKNFKVIPNYSSESISEEEFIIKMSRIKKDEPLKIVFARRFCTYRGTLLFANCVDRILSRFTNVDFTFAGGGELKDELETRYAGNPRVHITSFSAPDSISFHRKYDVAVVPTVYSEGTSLSLLEAMSAGCFPIASHVGGLTNVIIDHYNGILCYPDEDGVYNALLEVISMDVDDFMRIATNAYHSAVEAFSVDLWKKRWSGFIDAVNHS